MHKKFTIKAAAFALGVVLAIGMTACAAGTAAPTNSSSEAETKSVVPAAPADLTGTWKQSNAKSTDAWQAATVTATTIEVNWVTDGGDTTSRYWAGSYTPPTAAGDFSWTSKADSRKNNSSMLASSDPTKVFTYSAAEKTISYKVTALGTTTTIRLKKIGK